MTAIPAPFRTQITDGSGLFTGPWQKWLSDLSNTASSTNLTGAIISSGNVTSLGSFSSANLATALTDKTGTGLTVFSSSPALTTPAFTGNPTGTVTSGTYTPTLTNGANVAASTAYTCQYMRVGNVVTVSGRVDIDPTATGASIISLSLPVASSLSATENLGGTTVCQGVSQFGSILGLGGLARIDFIATNTAQQGWFFQFTYLIN